jgi:hypothetical protein
MEFGRRIDRRPGSLRVSDLKLSVARALGVLAAALVVGVGLAGCEAAGKPFQVEVRLIDDEDGRAVTQGVVRAQWWDARGFWNLKGMQQPVGLVFSAPLDDQGVARIEASTLNVGKSSSFRFSLDHPNPSWKFGRSVRTSKVYEIAERGETLVVKGLVWRSTSEKRVRVVLPPGFSGLVRVMAPALGADGRPVKPWTEGQREFTVRVSSDGTGEWPSHPTLAVRDPGYPDHPRVETFYVFESLGGGDIVLQRAWPTDQTVVGLWAWYVPPPRPKDVMAAWFIGTQEQYRAAYPPGADGREANPR